MSTISLSLFTIDLMSLLRATVPEKEVSDTDNVTKGNTRDIMYDTVNGSGKINCQTKKPNVYRWPRIKKMFTNIFLSSPLAWLASGANLIIVLYQALKDDANIGIIIASSSISTLI